jgi:hypothetical protein
MVTPIGPSPDANRGACPTQLVASASTRGRRSTGREQRRAFPLRCARCGRSSSWSPRTTTTRERAARSRRLARTMEATRRPTSGSASRPDRERGLGRTEEKAATVFLSLPLGRRCPPCPVAFCSPPAWLSAESWQRLGVALGVAFQQALRRFVRPCLAPDLRERGASRSRQLGERLSPGSCIGDALAP